MIGYALDAAHRGFQAATRPFRERKPAPNPLAVVHGVLDALEQSALKRGETQAVHRIRLARTTVTHEALKVGR